MILRTFYRPILAGSLVVGSGFSYYYSEEAKNGVTGVIRFGRAARTVLNIAFDYNRSLYSGNVSPNSPQYLAEKSKVHQRSADKLLELCCMNGGAFIKVGQHLGSLEYLLPYEYVNTLKILHSKAPKAPIEDIYNVLQKELKEDPRELFVEFDAEPLGAASLAQVHRARLKNGEEVAVKVQYPAVFDHSKVDMKGMEVLVKIVSTIFSDFQFQWLVDEMKRNLPKELNFTYEGRNAERLSKMFSHLPWLKIPSINWSLSTDKVLTMEFCKGGQVNDLEYMESHGIDPNEVSKKLGDLYSEMIFVQGYVHCDPHPGNILVDKRGNGTDIVLLDHGLYANLTESFRLSYGDLWLSILKADLKEIEQISRDMGLGDLFGLFTCMLTARSWDSISKGINKNEITSQEQDEIKSDAAKYLPEIAEVLNRVPRQMLLIFKTNDLLRGIEYSLNTNKSMKSFISMSRCCIRAVYDQRRKFCSSILCSISTNLAEHVQQFRLTLYSVYLWVIRLPLIRKLDL